MSVLGRGTKNAFRNSIRTVAIVCILALSIALALVMYLSRQAVDAKTTDVKGSVVNAITVTPAGARGFQGGGNPLTAADVATIKKTPHVTSVTSSVNRRLRTEGTSTGGGGGPGGGAQNDAIATTSLTSPTPPGVLGQQNNGVAGGNGTFQLPANFSLPIQLVGTDNPTSTQVSAVSSFKITAGSTIDGTGSDMVALVGKDLAAKNNLSVGSTFKAYGQDITVKGIYDTGNAFTDAGVIMPLATVQSLSGESGVTNIFVRVDSIENVDPTVTVLQQKLGSTADVVSDNANDADTLASLDNIKTIATYSLIGALIAGATIIFLSMLMIVRERRREIGVLKAIGSSNSKISLQFVTEAITLTLMGAVAGVVVGIALSNPVLDVLVNSSSQSPTTTQAATFPGPGGGLRGNSGAANGNGNAVAPGNGFRNRVNFNNVFANSTQLTDTLDNLSTSVGFSALVFGLLAAIGVAIVGSAFPSFMIAKIRPAEVMRTE